MKIKSIKFYQAVYLGKLNLPSYANDEYVSDAAQRKGITATQKENGVELRQNGNCTFVPFANVAYIQFAEEIKPVEAPKPQKPAKP